MARAAPTRLPREAEARPLPTVRYWWRKYVKDPWLRMWQGGVFRYYDRNADVMQNSRLSSLYYDLGMTHLGDVPPWERSQIRRGVLENTLNNDEATNEYAQGIVKQILVERMQRVGVTGQNFGGARGVVRLANMTFEEVYELHRRIEEASEISNRLQPTDRGFEIESTFGQVMIDDNGTVGGFGAASPMSKPVFIEPSHMFDQGPYDSARGSEMARSLFLSKPVTDTIERYWKYGGHSLAHVLTSRRGAIKAAVQKAILPDSMAAEGLPLGTTNKQMELAKRLTNAIGGTTSDASHFFWQIRNNVPHGMMWELGKQIRRVEDFATTWPDYYFKPAGDGPDRAEKRDLARNMIFRRLLEANLDIDDDAKLLQQVRFITARMQYPTAVREKRIMELAREMQRLTLLRKAIASADADEAERVMSGKRGPRFGMSAEEHEALDQERRAAGRARPPQQQDDQLQRAA